MKPVGLQLTEDGGVRGEPPFVIRAVRAGSPAALEALLEAERPYLERRLLEEGALLFRGFQLQGAADLASVVRARRAPALGYVGGDSPRRLLHEGVYTSTDVPPHVTIALHNEMSYLPCFPRHLFFHCAEAAEAGGETTLADGRALLERLDPAVRQRFEQHGVRYQLSFRGPGGPYALLDRFQKVTKSWPEAFETDDRRVVEERLKSWDARHRWVAGDRLLVETHQPAVRQHPITGDRVWFSQAHLFQLGQRLLGWTRFLLLRLLFPLPRLRPGAWYGDGTPIDDRALDHLIDALEASTRAVRWERGDLLWVDNVRCLHGRLPFRGQRRILVSMTDD